jgi:hypothetical protein
VIRVDHASVTGSCVSCHNGTTAPGKPGNHIATSNTCDDCHVTTNWSSVRFDHNGVSGSCTSCHNGQTATGKGPTHIQTSAQCDGCHSTLAWVPAQFDHNLVSGSCTTCHNGQTAPGKPGNHFNTTLQCDTCHDATRWEPVTFRHSSPNYPGDHGRGVECRDCHRSNSQTVTWQWSAYKPDCAGCHAGDYERDEHKKIENPRTYYTVSELRDCTGACHTYTDSSLTRIRRSRTGQHRVNGEFD